MLFFSL